MNHSLWRIAHRLYQGGRISHQFGQIVEIVYNIAYSNAISAQAQIGDGTVFFHHGLGCVIHRNASIGKQCNIMQNVTVGEKYRGGVKGGNVPCIGEKVTIGAGAVLLGDISVGDNAIIGANAVVLCDVPPGAMAVGVPARIINVKGAQKAVSSK